MAKVNLRAYNREIETMIDRGQLDEAIAHSHHILKTYPKHLETYRLLGKAYLEYKRYGDAADIFSRVLVSVPNDFVSQVGMSIIRDEENKLDDAIWHMERAFETQPSNPAIQSELQRLYGRRDGVQPPRIRMTRGALAHMYVQGELYPQAISEIKSVLNDDPGRSDMQALLARAYYKSGLKNEAADVASALLRRYPYSLDANRVLVEILSVDHPENAQLYRQRVVELDPYSAQGMGTTFQSNEAPDASVNIERLDWNGQPVSMQPDWGETNAIGLESSAARDEQPDWLKSPFGEMTPAKPTVDPFFETPAPSEPAPAQPAEEIPEFMREAGWGKSTGAFDESKSMFAEEESASDEPIAQGDLPDWVKAMKPPEPEPAAQEQEEALPDWINKIGTGALSTQASDQLDWMNQPEQTPATPATEDQPDWLKGFDQPEAAATPSDDQPDWLKGFDSESDITPQPAQTETPDWLKGLGTESEVAPAEQEDQSDWLNQFNAETEAPASEVASTDFDFLNQLTEEPILQTPDESPMASNMDINNLGVSEKEQDDSFAWLESLAAKQGASEGLLTKPEDRLEEEPEWVKQAKALNATQPPASIEPLASQPTSNLEEPASTEPEPEDSFAWLENLGDKQDATDDLFTTPEPEMDAKDLESQLSSTLPSSNLEQLGTSEQEQDDSFAWLESLAAKQGATEGLLTKPEERLEQEPEWVRQAKDLSAQQPPVSVTPEPQPEPAEPEPESEQPAAMDQTGMWLKSIEEEEKTSEPVSAADATAMWLKSLDEEEKRSEPVSETDETAMWLKSLDEAESAPVPAAEPAADDLPAWMQNIAAEEAEPESLSMPAIEEPVAMDESKLEEESIPNWLADLDKEETQTAPTGVSDDDLPAWLRAEEAAPEATEPTRSTDWRPVEEKQPEIIYSPPLEEIQPEIIYSPPLEELKEPEAVVIEEPVEMQEQPQVEPEPVMKVTPEPTPVREPYQESETRRSAGMTVTPSADPVLGSARNELSRSNIPGALESYAKLIKKGRFLDEVIYDLREALYRYPVEVNIWQSLGDAYMRANRLQDALDAYTKAEELLR